MADVPSVNPRKARTEGFRYPPSKIQGEIMLEPQNTTNSNELDSLAWADNLM